MNVPDPTRAPHDGWQRRLGVFAAVLVTFLTLAAGRAALDGRHALWDERLHGDQIAGFAAGEGWAALRPDLPQLPGYHLVVAGLARIAGRADLSFFRLCSTLFGALAVAAFALAYRRMHGGGELVAAGQLLFLPILFPFLFLAYTDALALVLVSVALLCWTARRPHCAAWALVACTGVRQDAVVWLASLCGVLLARPFTTRWRDAASAMLGLVAFSVFVVLNGGVAFGDAQAHPFPGVYLGNVYLASWLVFGLFPFLHLDNARRILSRLRSDRRLRRILIGVVPVYLLTLPATHPYNQIPDCLHNWLVIQASTTLVGAAMSLVAFVVAWLSLLETPLRAGTALPFYACTVASLCAHWLVEPRYTLVPFTLFLLLRERRGPRIEAATLSWLAAASGALWWAVSTGRAFP